MSDGAFSRAKQELLKGAKIAPDNWEILLEIAKCDEKFYFSPIKSLYKEYYMIETVVGAKTFHFSVIYTTIKAIIAHVKEMQITSEEYAQIANKLAVTMFFASCVTTSSYLKKLSNFNGDTFSERYALLENDCSYEKFKSIDNIEKAIEIISDLNDKLSIENVTEMKHYICSLVCDLTYNSRLSGNKELIEKYKKYRNDVRVLYPQYGVSQSEMPDPFSNNYEQMNYYKYEEKKKKIFDYWVEFDKNMNN